VLSLQKKGMYNHVADLCEHWNGVVDICNGRDRPHMPCNAAQRKTVLFETLAWFSRWKELHDKRVEEKHATAYNFFCRLNLVLHQVIVAGPHHRHSSLLCDEGWEY
jgi:hypothetical protein